LEPIKIGHIVDLTGIEGMLGEQYKSALEYAVESLGGEFAGRPVEIVIGDAQNQPAVAADTARKMVEVDKVSAIFGPTQIGQKGAVAEYVKEAGIPLIFYNPTPEMMIQDNKWLVGANGGIPQMPTTMADYAYNDLGYRTVHTITLDNMGARMFIDGFTEPFTAMGGTVVSQQWAPAPVGDWAPYLATLSDADALVVWCSSTDAISFWNAYYEMGVYERFPVITPMHGGFVDYFVAEAVNAINPAAAELMLNTHASIMYVRDIDSPENAEYVAGWNKAFGHDPLFCEGSVPQAVYLLNSALEATGGDTSPDRLIEAIFDADFTGPEGHQFFNESQIATKDVYIAKVVKLANGGFSYETVKSYKDVPPAGLSK
jgi:branched-chain amino acid transport system substrate-binding protein